MPRSLFPAAAALLLMATAVPAQTVLPGDHSVDGDLCVGGSCTGSEVFDSDLNAHGFEVLMLCNKEHLFVLNTLEILDLKKLVSNSFVSLGLSVSAAMETAYSACTP